MQLLLRGLDRRHAHASGAGQGHTICQVVLALGAGLNLMQPPLERTGVRAQHSCVAQGDGALRLGRVRPLDNAGDVGAVHHDAPVPPGVSRAHRQQRQAGFPPCVHQPTQGIGANKRIIGV